MPERKRDTSKKRQSILDAAVETFVNQGYDGASMDQIAEAAKASKRTVYNHFPSKEALFRAVIDRFLAQSAELKRVSYDPQRSLEQQLGLFVDSMLALTKNPSWLGLMKVMTGVVIHSPELVAETLAKVYEEEDTLATWLKAATEDGRLRVSRPALAAKTFWGMLNGVFLLPAIYAAPPSAREAAAMKKELTQMLLARYAAGEGASRSSLSARR